MPERISLGGASFELRVDGSNFGPELVRAEQQARAASQKIATALGGPGGGSAGRGTIAIGVRVDSQTADKAFADIQRRAREVSANSKISLSITANGEQAEQEIKQVESALARAAGRDRVTIQLRASAEQAEQTLGRLQGEIRAAEQRGARINISIDTRSAEERLARFQQLVSAAGRGVVQGSGVGEGFLFGSGAGAGAIAALGVATAVSQLTQATVAGIRAGVTYNSLLEQQTNTLVHYTGSAEAAAKAREAFHKLDVISPFNEQEVGGAGTNFIRISDGDIQRAEELTALTVQLAAAHPERGFEDMQGAIQQLISGDFQAFEDRTNIAFGTVRRLAEQGLTGLKLYGEAVKAAGGSPELLSRNASTFQARLSTLESNIQKFQASATKGAFEALSGDIDAVNQSVDRNAEGWGKLAERIGAAATEAFKFSAIGQAAGSFGQAGAFLAERFQPAASSEAAQQADTTSADQLARQELTRQKDEAAKIQAQLKLNEDAAKKVTTAYEQAIAPLQRQLEIINRPNFDLQRRQVAADQGQTAAAEATLAAQGPVDTRADVAAARAVLQIEREGIDIRQRRAAIAEQIGQAEQSIARRTAEIQLRAAEEGVRARQTRLQAESQARQDSIAGLQEEIRVRRQTVQDEQSRIQEVTQVRRQVVADAISGEREIADATRERFTETERLLDRQHQRSQEVYRAEIERLQEINRIANQPRGPSATEQALAKLDARERAFQAARTLAEAKTAVKQADTPDERKAAQRRLDEVKHEQDVARRREQLEQRIKREREAADAARLAREEQIRQLEAKAREEDRAFQREKDARAEQERIADRVAAQQIQAEEKAERLTQRAEDTAARAAEKSEREAQRAEDEQLRAQQKADREADRAAQREIAGSLAAIAGQRAGLQAADDQAGLARDQSGLANLKELSDNEVKELDLRQKLLDGQDAFLSAAAARDTVVADNASKLVAIAAQQDAAQKLLDSLPLQERLADAKLRLDEELAPLETQARDLEQRLRDVKAEITAAQDALAALSKRGQENAGRGPGEPPSRDQAAANVTIGIAPPLPEQIASWASGVSQQLSQAFHAPALAEQAGGAAKGLGDALVTGLGQFFAQDRQTPADVTKWTQDSIIAPAEQALEIRSPSRVSERWADDVAAGFVQGLQGSESIIGPAMVQVFDLAWQQYLQPWFTGENGLQAQLGVHFGASAAGLDTEATEAAFGRGMFLALQGGYEGSVIPFFTASDGIGAQLGTHFGAAAGHLNSSTTQQAIGTAMHNALTSGFNLALRDQTGWWESFKQLGENLAISIQNGYVGYFNANPLQSPSGGSTGGSIATSSGSTAAAQGSTSRASTAATSSGSTLRAGQYDVENYLKMYGLFPGDPNFDRYFDYYFSEQAKGHSMPADMVITGHAMGGFIPPKDWSWVGERGPELIRAGGSGLDVRSNPDSLAMLAGAGRGATTLNMPISIDARGVTNAEQMFQQVAPRIVRTVINIIDAAERGAPDPAPVTLGGA